ncbi:uncharacterized protein LOC133627096 isoform X1 [Colius striatus]|uniref:uncharacterized protein LOC133627096 isoform X1 n=1 Tax=Colius striatus TaxID=57412 RepID=UPI002B1E4570|nr:uncharacterized protein LOC133627096 isoform X1 [Colius striatus]
MEWGSQANEQAALAAGGAGRRRQPRRLERAALRPANAPGGARPPVPAARHMALCCFLSPAPPGPSPPPPSPSRSVGVVAARPPPARAWGGMARPGRPAAPICAGPHGLARSRLLCCSASRHGRLRCYMCLGFFFFLLFFFFLNLFLSFPVLFPSRLSCSSLWVEAWGLFWSFTSFVLSGKLYLVLHCRPKLEVKSILASWKWPTQATCGTKTAVADGRIHEVLQLGEVLTHEPGAAAVQTRARNCWGSRRCTASPPCRPSELCGSSALLGMVFKPPTTAVSIYH